MRKSKLIEEVHARRLNEGVVTNTMTALKFEAKDNRRLRESSLVDIFEKAGKYIFHMGMVTFLEQLIINYSLVVYAFRKEQKILDELEAEDMGKSDVIKLPFLDANMYSILMFGYFLGNFLSLNTVLEIALFYPALPTTFQAINLLLIFICLKYALLTDLYIFFFWTMWVGVQTGTCYTSWCYLACTKFNEVKGVTFDM